MTKSKRRSDCAINFVLELFGDRWTLLIVRDLMFQGKHYYGEFLGAEENIATNILADRLVMLEEEGIVTKSVDPAHGSKFIYRLSSKGIDLLPILLEYIVWSAKHDADSGVDMKFVNRIRRDREGVLREISSRLKKE
jgi:DNA-binding HxlR family transcriptional regulator